MADAAHAVPPSRVGRAWRGSVGQGGAASRHKAPLARRPAARLRAFDIVCSLAVGPLGGPGTLSDTSHRTSSHRSSRRSSYL